MVAKRSALVALLGFLVSGVALAGGEQGQPKKQVKPNPLHVKLTTQMPGVIVQFGTAAKALAVGDRVEKEEVLVLFDDRLARLDLDVARARLTAAQAERDAGVALAEESKKRMETALRLFEQGAMSREDKDAAILTFRKYAE